jgi:hypothetical protein
MRTIAASKHAPPSYLRNSQEKRYADEITMVHPQASLNSMRNERKTAGIEMASDGVSMKPPVLTSWKEIAAYFGKGVRTVQRWEGSLGLPVRRPQGSASRNIVMATRSELDAWLQTQWKAAARDAGKASVLIKNEVEAFQTRLKTFQQLKEQNVQLQREMKDAVRELLDACKALKESPNPVPARTVNVLALEVKETKIRQRTAS